MQLRIKIQFKWVFLLRSVRKCETTEGSSIPDKLMDQDFPGKASHCNICSISLSHQKERHFNCQNAKEQMVDINNTKYHGIQTPRWVFAVKIYLAVSSIKQLWHLHLKIFMFPLNNLATFCVL